MSAPTTPLAQARADLATLLREMTDLQLRPPGAGATRRAEQVKEKQRAIDGKKKLIDQLQHYPLFPEQP